MHKTLIMAAAATALMATPALAQDARTTDPIGSTSASDVTGTAPTDAGQPPIAEAAAEAAVQARAAASAEPATEADIVAVLRADSRFSTLVQALDASGLSATLEADDSISILAPTNEAFAALPTGELERLMAEESREELQDLLLYHVINADVRPEQIENRRGPVVTGSGAQVMLDGGNGVLRADAALISNAELRGSNGGIFALDQVLNPETSLAAQGDAEATLEEAAEADAAVESEVEATVEAEVDVAAPVDVELEAPTTETLTSPLS